MRLAPAPATRDWMDATPQGFANRCLPLTIANGFGWQIGADLSFRSRWDGRAVKEGLTIEPLKTKSAAPGQLPISHFGSGILTFHVHGLFRSEPGINLFVTGPINRPKDGIAPLTGIVETDWSPFTFTMNWQFTRPDHWVTFQANEPICQIFPVEPARIEATEPEFRAFSSDPETKAQFEAWSQSRQDFNEALRHRQLERQSDGWQKNYHRGQTVDGEKTEFEHRTKIRLKAFANPSQGET